MKKELEKVYDPKQVEDKTYRFWVEKRYFHAEPNPKKKPYTIVIPPPNITGQLHLGHALDCTLQDSIIRFKRMQGYEALWLPGNDHASIATEAKIVEAMRKEGVTKDDLGREGFLERAWEWKKTYGGKIVEQLKKMGSSCDWERERFTLDEGCSEAVKEVFVRLYEKGLIYRGERIINWCPHCLTSISDAEVEYEEHDGHFWHIRYPLSDGSGYLEIATTRPETLLGDTALAVHPDDERYQALVGKTVILPLVGREIPIVADSYVEMDFGTGVVKITPAHDPNDFEVGLRHNLPVINVMNDDATINENGGKYRGMDRYECRKQIVADLEAEGFLVKVEDHKHNVGSCYRCSTTVEPRVSKQWFVKMGPLAGPAIEAVRSGETKFVPDRFSKIYYHWMENIKDWCISRQLWWGHRIPAWYCQDCGEVIVAKEEPHTCPKCGSKNLQQDPDTLDTWFSSALWPFSTLGWPNQTEELKYFYPTSTLVTGYDIIFFWVARMIFSGVENMGKSPFETVFIHGIVRDAQGRKMSKSLGNGIDPLKVIDEYGADALRFTLATGNSPGNDMRFVEEKVKASRNFANKIWNATRFILMNLSDEIDKPELPQRLQTEDKWILSKLNTLIKEVTENLERFELGIAVQKLYDFIWDVLCDWYIELTKSRIQAGGESAKSAQQVLIYVMNQCLKLLHPIMPFITEEIWQAIPNDCESIMVAPWPQYREDLCFQQEEEDFEKVMSAIKAIRNRRAEMNVPPSKKARVFVKTLNTGVFESGAMFIERLASASEVKVSGVAPQQGEDFSDAVQVITDSARIFIPLDELVDKEKELARLEKERKACDKDIAMVEQKLSSQGFIEKAPQNVVEAERAKLEKHKERMEKIVESIAAFSK
ncbi:MAG: valine--tRNA ligase [Oscillospiraceae bacterium]|nr:valine--tRNA ligase [Oscillospiraceae bacterium]MDD7040354.1 valine--tRNA ligase [Oscillospiraceae bacterium]MDY2612053.1 valine--tRNA ligase [Oscillospiraceae bacterium]